MSIGNAEIVGILVGASFAAGLNVYATVATLGLLAQSGAVTLPPSLQMIDSWWAIGPALALFIIEFFADKVPGFDLVWNALQTFVKVPAAALLAYGASSKLPPGEQLLATVLGGLIGLAAHGGKTAARTFVTPSPEPLSNIGLSLGEDVVAIALTWMATSHPYATISIVAVLLLIIVFVIRFVWRALRKLFRGAEQQVSREVRAGG
jgi:hypothetical protein